MSMDSNVGDFGSPSPGPSKRRCLGSPKKSLGEEADEHWKQIYGPQDHISKRFPQLSGLRLLTKAIGRLVVPSTAKH
jgi:hypothetical protein